MRVGILSLQHESNTFLAAPTTLDDFARDVLATGEAVRTRFRDTHHELAGMFEELERQGAEAVPIFAAKALPSGTIAADAYTELLKRLLEALESAGRIDGLLVAPHGAAVCEAQRDADGHWLSRVRECVGPGVPMIGTLDPHANVSGQMVAACEALVAYRTNPHVDQRAVGREAAGLLVTHLRRGVDLTQAAAFPAVAINIEKQHTDTAPCKPMYDFANQLGADPAVLSTSILLGFPYADVEEMGSGFIVVTDGNVGLAQERSRELVNYLESNRQAFVPQFVSVEAALDDVERGDGPVCLLDMGDNVGGGSPGDGTWIAHAVHQRGGPKTFVALCDASAADRARHVGVGGRVRLRMGGTSDARHGPPLESDVTVRSVHDGIFSEEQPRHGGMTRFDMGPTAVVTTDRGLTMQLHSRRIAPFSLNQLTSCGVDPRAFEAVVAKGVNAPVAAYASACRRFIRVNTGGVTSADLTKFDYRHRRRPLFPIEDAPGDCLIVEGHRYDRRSS